MIYENIDKALDAIHKISFDKGLPKYYRGQRKNHNITSSIHRLSDKEKVEQEANKSNAFVQWLKDQHSLLPSIEALNESLCGTDLAYWAVAQHYGYKTDLIDFTTSLEIATAFSLLRRKNGDTGVIYCLWEEDILHLAIVFLVESGNLEPRCCELIKSANYNPFFEFQISELSRIANQHGLFLWDLNGLVTSYLNQTLMKDQDWVDSHCFYFYQTDTNIDVNLLRKVYPEPNSVEMMIDQFVQLENKHNFYKYYKNLLDNVEIVDPLSPDAPLVSFEENDYSILKDIFAYGENVFYPRDGIDPVSYDIDFETISHLEEDSFALQFTKFWFEGLKNGKYIFFTGSDPIVKLYAELINEVLALKGIFPAFYDEVLSVIIQKVISILGSLLLIVKDNSPQKYIEAYKALYGYQFNLNDTDCNIDHILDDLRNQVCLNDLAADVWGDTCVFLKIVGCNDTISLGVLPLQFVNDLTPDYKKRQMEKLLELLDQNPIPSTQIVVPKVGNIYRIPKEKEEITLKDLFYYVSSPKILFSAEDMFRIMIYCFIPWQMVMCPKRSRLYNPLEFKKLLLSESENIANSKLHYLGGAYVITTLPDESHK